MCRRFVSVFNSRSLKIQEAVEVMERYNNSEWADTEEQAHTNTHKHTRTHNPLPVYALEGLKWDWKAVAAWQTSSTICIWIICKTAENVTVSCGSLSFVNTDIWLLHIKTDWGAVWAQLNGCVCSHLIYSHDMTASYFAYLQYECFSSHSWRRLNPVSGPKSKCKLVLDPNSADLASSCLFNLWSIWNQNVEASKTKPVLKLSFNSFSVFVNHGWRLSDITCWFAKREQKNQLKPFVL